MFENVFFNGIFEAENPWQILSYLFKKTQIQSNSNPSTQFDIFHASLEKTNKACSV